MQLVLFMGGMFSKGGTQSRKTGRLIFIFKEYSKRMKIIEPRSSEEFKKYYNLRYEILRKPWRQPKGSERDEDEDTSIHRMIIDEKIGEVLAVGRLQFNSADEAQIRYMAVADDLQGKGLGGQIISSLEDAARGKGTQRVILSARENALQFYRNNGYEIVKKTHLLFGEIQHWLMKKELE